MRREVTVLVKGQEPKSKKSMTAEEKRQFQRTVLSELKWLKKRAFRSDIALELLFSCQEPNPPLIHTLAKNYVDLLSKPVAGSEIKRKHILYEDDKQVKTLIVNYTVGSPFSLFSIVIRALPMRDFLSEFELLARIKHDNFSEEGSRHSSRYDDLWDDLREDLNYNIREAKQQVKYMKDAKTAQIKKIGNKRYSEMLSFWQSHLQRCVLRSSQLNLERCLLLFPTSSGKLTGKLTSSKWMKDLEEYAREAVVGRMFSLDLKDWPRKSGQSKAFKSRIDTELEVFKKEYPYLIKLKTLLSLVIIFVPPKGGQVDSDNIARVIVPKVNDFFEPPSQLLIRSEDKEQLKKLRIPEHSVVRYEVIQLPRTKNDPDEGFVRLIFGDGMDNRGIWSAMDNVIRDWMDSIDRGI